VTEDAGDLGRLVVGEAERSMERNRVGGHAGQRTGAVATRNATCHIGEMAKGEKRQVTEAHKAAMAEGRTQSRAISGYLDALESNRPKRGRKRTQESIDKRLGVIADQFGSANGITRLALIQERMDLLAEKQAMSQAVDLSGLVEEFVKAAKSYGERKGISYSAWRELGVPPEVLKRAGIARTGS
jgi:hypothetical protein